MTIHSAIAVLILAAAPAGATQLPPHCRPTASILDIRRPTQPEWFGLYLMNKKAGWLRTSVARQKRGEKPVLVAHQEMLIEAKVGSRSVRRSQSDEKVYEARPGGRLISYSSARSGDGGDRKLQLDCGPRVCTATLSADDGIRVLEVPLPAETAEQADAARLAAARCGVVEGAQLQAEDLRERKMKDRFTERKTLGGAGVTFPVDVIDEFEEGDRLAAKVLVGGDGRIVEFRYGDALVAKPEPEDIAKRIDEIDLFNMSRIPLPAALPRRVPAEITYFVRGLPEAFYAEDQRQRYARGAEGETILTVMARRPAADDPARDLPRKVPDAKGGEDLRATPEIDWDHPAVRKVSETVAAQGSTPASSGTWATARRLSRAVHDRLEKVYGQSRDRASEVLRSGKGDCTEHALLFVALARASGIPARGVHGLVYANYGDGGPGLYWHAWAEVRVGDDWIAIDPTFDQDVADATHIALGRGTRVDAVGLIGALTVTKAEVKQ
jgi:transglutaminase-like putative cysteine protease